MRLLACQTCGGSFEAGGDDLRCQHCGATVPVVRGIPRFVPDSSYAGSFGRQWNRFRSVQLDSVNGTNLSRRRLLDETGWAPEWLRGKTILDAGCGSGRFAEVAAQCGAHVVAVDLSSAVDAVAETVSGPGTIDVVQASITDLPFRPGTFDGVYCIGVVQHTPSPEATLKALPPLLKPGGRLAVTIYERRRFTKLNGKYAIRPLTRRLPSSVVERVVRLAMPLLFPLTEVLYRLPVLGRGFRFVLPVANYVGHLPLSVRQRYSWAVLDTVDMLTPAYDQPQTESEARKAIDGALVRLRRLPNPGVNLVGERPPGDHS